MTVNGGAPAFVGQGPPALPSQGHAQPGDQTLDPARMIESPAGRPGRRLDRLRTPGVRVTGLPAGADRRPALRPANGIVLEFKAKTIL